MRSNQSAAPMQVVPFQESHVEAYEAFLRRWDHSLFSHSDRYRRLLKDSLRAEDHYLLLFDNDGTIRAALPAFLRRNRSHGNVLNSLPFFGSNGGFIQRPGDGDAMRLLADSFSRLAAELDCAASTIIASPLGESTTSYERVVSFDYRDVRMGQVTELPAAATSEALMGLFHSKTRNMVRKALKAGVRVSVENGPRAWAFLVATHGENLARLGGPRKDPAFFESVRRMCQEGRDYRLYVAHCGHQPVAALLLFYFNRVVEYFTPVVLKAFRPLQPLSLLIFQAMRDAAEARFRYWNWGGTRKGQESLYRFKKRWGTLDRPYHYYTRIYDRRILDLDRDRVLDEYPNFYVVPFDQLDHPVDRDVGSCRARS